jgi:acetyl-CoA carboxylase biotin carboxyl carrier protein
MEIKDIRSLIKMVTENDITEFELENPEEKIRIKRGVSPQITYYEPSQSVPAAGQANQPMTTTIPSTENIKAEPGSAAAAVEKGEAITSPIVGTMYCAPSPDAPPYVEAGQVVEKGQVLCIVEAMKLMNEIEAEFRCKIIEICKENAQPVEFGEPLFIVERL